MKLFRTLASALMGLVLTAGVAFAVAETNISTGLTLKGPGLAAHGYDVVAYFTTGQPTLGRADFSTVYSNATYRFASQEHLEAFQKEPAKYVPQFGGFCAFGVSVGAKFDGDPSLWRIVDGKLYLNLNREIQKKWQEDIPGNIKKAEGNWQRIAGKTPQELS